MAKRADQLTIMMMKGICGITMLFRRFSCVHWHADASAPARRLREANKLSITHIVFTIIIMGGEEKLSAARKNSMKIPFHKSQKTIVSRTGGRKKF